MSVLPRWRARVHQLREEHEVRRERWAVERDVERAVSGRGPLIAGPWLSEVGYEVLYWIPFLRWVQAAYRVPADRIVAVSRGGTGSWYGGIAGRYVEAFDFVTPAALAARAAAGDLKQRAVSPLDEDVLNRVRQAADLRRARVLHPSLMFRWFAPFWSGHEALAFAESHMRHARIAAPDVQLPVTLPSEYVAVKLYSARALPDSPAVRTQVQALVSSLAERLPIVQLDAGIGVDEHSDYRLEVDRRSISVSGLLDPRTNLAVQTRIIAGARLFVGTCGSLAWLAPFLGVDTMPLFSDASFLHAHLHLARRVFGRAGGGRFTPIDLGGLIDAGLAIDRPHRVAATPAT
jgi:hypothetical protein